MSNIIKFPKEFKARPKEIKLTSASVYTPATGFYEGRRDLMSYDRSVMASFYID